MNARKAGSRGSASRLEHSPVVNGEPTETIDCRSAPLTFGRSRVCSVVLDAPAVEQRHAALFAAGGRFELTDQSSGNGICVNSRTIGHAWLNDGDQVEIGPYLFYFHRPYLVWVRPPVPVTLTADRIEQAASGFVLLSGLS